MSYSATAAWIAIGFSSSIVGATLLFQDQEAWGALVLLAMGLYVATHALLVGVETAVHRGGGKLGTR